MFHIVVSSDSPWRVCYFTNWARWRGGTAAFQVRDIDTSLCSHFIYSFATMAGNSLTHTDPDDVSGLKL